MIKQFVDLRKGDYLYAVVDKNFTELPIVDYPIFRHGALTICVDVPELEIHGIQINIPSYNAYSSYWGAFSSDGTMNSKMHIMAKSFYNNNKLLL